MPTDFLGHNYKLQYFPSPYINLSNITDTE